MAQIERSYLGEAAAKLSRLLTLSGLVSPKFDLGESITPTVLLGDGTAPGYGDRSGKRWAVGGVAAGGGVGAYLGIEATGEIVVEGVEFGTNTSGQFTLRWNTATEASPSGAPFPSFVPALDRASNVNLSGPLTFLAQGGAAPAGVTSRILHMGLATAGFSTKWTHPFHMMRGSRLWMEQSIPAATVYCSFWGRAF